MGISRDIRRDLEPPPPVRQLQIALLLFRILAQIQACQIGLGDIDGLLNYYRDEGLIIQLPCKMSPGPGKLLQWIKIRGHQAPPYSSEKIIYTLHEIP